MKKNLFFTTLPATIERFLQTAVRLAFSPVSSHLGLAVAALWLGILFILGVHAWGIFYSQGDIAFDFSDWGEVTGPRYAVLRNAAETGQFPLHVGDLTALRNATDRYFSIADTPFSPEYLLLPYLGTGQYLYYDVLLWYTVGFAGLLILMWRYRLSLFTFSLVFWLYNFNGFQISHLAIGHANWVAMFLIPYFVLLALHLAEHQRFSWRWVLGLSVLQAVILLEGGFHLFVWCMLFLGVMAIFNPRLLKAVSAGVLFTGLVGLPRLLPPALALKEVTNEFLGGFPSVTDLFASLVTLRTPAQLVQPLNDTLPLNGWEVDFYIGAIGAALLIGFGIILPLVKKHWRPSQAITLLAPSLALTFLSIGEVYSRLTWLLPVPPLTGERVTARMLILPLLVALTLAAICLQRVLNENKLSALSVFFALGSGYLIYHDLMQHMEAWRIRKLDAMVDLFPKLAFDPANHTLSNHADPVYLALLVGGAVVAVAALVFLTIQAARRAPQSTNESA